MIDRRAWVYSLRTIQEWSKLLNTGIYVEKRKIELQIGLLDHYAELCILSKMLDRKIPSWVAGKI